MTEKERFELEHEMTSITLNGKSYRLVALLDAECKEVEDSGDVHFVLVQDFDDVRPQGVTQTYKTFRIKPETFKKELAQ